MPNAIGESFYENVFSSIGEIVLIIDVNGCILQMNDAAERFTGYPTFTVQGIPYFWEKFIPESEQALIRQFFNSKNLNHIPREVENHWISQSGEIRLFRWINTIIDDSSGQSAYLITVGTDIAQQRQMENSLRRSRDFHRLLARVSEAMAHDTEENQLLQHVCSLTVQYTDCKLTWIIKPNEEGWFQVLAAAGELGYLKNIRISTRADLPEGNGPVGRAWRTHRPVFDVQLGQDSSMSPWRDRIEHFGMKRTTTIPLLRNGNAWAIFAISHGEETNFDEELQALLLELADNIGYGLDRLDLAKQERQISQFNDTLLNSMTAGVNVMRYPERVIEKINPRMLEIYGAKSEAELVGHAGSEFYPDTTTYELVGSFSKKVLADGKGILRDVPYRRLDGSIIYVDLSGQRFDNLDGTQRIIWTHVEVTERHQNEIRIRKLNAQKTLLLDNTVAAIDLVRYPERVITEVNQRFLDMMGYDSPEEVIGLPTSVVYPNDEENERMAQLSQTVLTQGQGEMRDLIVFTRDGQPLYVDISGKRIDDDSHHPTIIWTSVDVTERHELTVQLEHAALFDSLTGLPNRRYLEEYMGQAIARADRNATRLALIMMDLDGFKAVNDTHGHDQGDLVLQIISKRLQQSMHPTDFVARLGGDEFVLILENTTLKDQIMNKLYKVEKSISAPISLQNKVKVKVGISAGVCFYPHKDIAKPIDLLHYADQALYESKAHKTDRHEFWKFISDDHHDD